MNGPETAHMRIEQVNASYDALQDRILLKIRASRGMEYRFWATRRFVSLLWTVLVKIAEDFAASRTGNPFARSSVAELAHGQAVGQADFDSQYQEGTEFPLGAEPVLLAKINLSKRSDSTQTLTLLPNQGQGVNLNLDEKLVHVFASLLQKAAGAADWGLKLDITSDDLSTLAGKATQPHRLH